MRYAIFLYDGIEPIDLGATFGVLSIARRVDPTIEMYGISRSAEPIVCANGLRVIPDYEFENYPGCDAFIITGGPGWQKVVNDTLVLAFFENIPEETFICAICTGVMILAASGLLNGHRATTKIETADNEISPIELLKEFYPEVETVESVAVRSGRFFTSGGVSLGIDCVLYLLHELNGKMVAFETARIMEYKRAWHSNAKARPAVGLSTDVTVG